MAPCFRAFVFLLPLYAQESSLPRRGIVLILTAKPAVQPSGKGYDIRSKVPNCLALVATLGKLYPCFMGSSTLRERCTSCAACLLACCVRHLRILSLHGLKGARPVRLRIIEAGQEPHRSSTTRCFWVRSRGRCWGMLLRTGMKGWSCDVSSPRICVVCANSYAVPVARNGGLCFTSA